MKKRLCYFMGVSGNLAFAAANVAIGVNKYCKDNDYDIVIFYSYMTEADRNAFLKIDHCVLRLFAFESEFTSFMMDKLPEECRFRTIDRLMCFAHYEAFRLLEEYENVIWLEPDMLIQDDIGDITKFGPIGFSDDGKFLVKDQFLKEPLTGYDLNRPAIRIGLMVLHDSLPYEAIYKWCYEKSYEYAEYSKNPEQAVINLMLEEFQIEPTIIPLEWHCDCGDAVAPAARILHAGLGKKFWNDYERYNVYAEWYRNHLKWKEAGGGEGEDFKFRFLPPRNLFQLLRIKRVVPFQGRYIPQEEKVIVYGAGVAGREYIEWLSKKTNCEIVAVLDGNADQIADIEVHTPDFILSVKEFDYIIIAIEDRRIAEAVKERLKEMRTDIMDDQFIINMGFGV